MKFAEVDDTGQRIGVYGPGTPQVRPSAGPAPLAAWVVAAALLLMFCASAFGFLRVTDVPASELFTNYNRERIEAFSNQARSDKAYRVVLLGSSLMKYATWDEKELTDELSSRAGSPVHVLRIVTNWGVFKDISSLAPALLDTDPDLVVIQSDLLVSNRPLRLRLVLLSKYLNWLLRRDGPWDVRPDRPEQVQFGTSCWKYGGRHSEDRQSDASDFWVEIDSEGSAAREAQHFLNDLRFNGSKLAVLYIPRRPDYESKYGSERRAAMSELAALAEWGHALDWQGPRLPAHLYCDLTHVSEQGREEFSTWLAARIEEVVSSSVPKI